MLRCVCSDHSGVKAMLYIIRQVAAYRCFGLTETSETLKLEARIHELESLAKREKYDRASAEASLQALKTQITSIRTNVSVSAGSPSLVLAEFSCPHVYALSHVSVHLHANTDLTYEGDTCAGIWGTTQRRGRKHRWCRATE